jgi:ATP citrate (pro-S)-lyase
MTKVNLQKLRTVEPHIICLGSHRGIIQSILDFDHASGKDVPSIRFIIASGRKSERYFFGEREVIIPVKPSLDSLTDVQRAETRYFINLSSGRRALVSTSEALVKLPNLVASNIFAEGVPERHALELKALAAQKDVLLAGASSVGIVVPGTLKLGAIGGTQAVQLAQSLLLDTDGQVAVISTSGGMVNEIIRTVARSGYGVSFAVALGGERFPMLGADEAFLLAENDPGTKSIVYFGELGGSDEYRIAELIKKGKVTKPVIAYVAGSVADLFEQPPQFGHAKAMAKNEDESAAAKSAALHNVGAVAAKTYGDFVAAINAQPQLTNRAYSPDLSGISAAARKPAMFANSVSYDKQDKVYILGSELLEFAGGHSFAYIVASMFLGRPKVSKELEEFIDFVLRLLVDHGPYVSGAVNTMISARAGKDLVSSLVTGLLTVGPRFGGAINDAAGIWLEGVESGLTAAELVESYVKQKRYLLGIGHKKYSIDNPDPRVKALLEYAAKDNEFVSFALAVQAETTQKKGNLILNVDGAIAAVLLGILHQKEGYSFAELHELVDAELFNGLFVLSRSVGFMAHYFDQRRIDEGLFRLGTNEVVANGGYPTSHLNQE